MNGCLGFLFKRSDLTKEALEVKEIEVKIEAEEKEVNTEGMQLSKNLSLAECIRSRTAAKWGIDNTPNSSQIEILKSLAVEFFQPVRDYFNKPLYGSSVYRSPELNKRIGGAGKSDHMILDDTAAIDLDNDAMNNGVTNAMIFWYIFDNMNFYKLIWEFGDDKSPSWIHISFSEDASKNRRKHVYQAHKPNGRTVYTIFKESNFTRTKY